MRTIALTGVLVILVLALPTSAGNVSMPLDGTWVTLVEYMEPGDYFENTYTVDSDYLIRFTVTDWNVISDQFEVYDNGNLIVTTPAMPDWDDLGYASPGIGGPFPPWTADPDEAFASGLYSSAVLYLGPGPHSITIRNIHIPPSTAGGDPFSQGTVAFKAEPLVEFTKVVTATGEGGDMDGRLEAGEDWTWTMTATLTNVSGGDITGIRMHDRLGGDLEWHIIAWTIPSSVDVYTKGKTEKVFIDWYDGFTLADGASVSAQISVSPDVNTGTGNGKKAGHQEYTSIGIHELNSGTWFEGYIGDEYIEASTEPVTVEVLEAD